MLDKFQSSQAFLSVLLTFFLKLFGCCKMLLTCSSVKPPLRSLIGATISLEVQKLLSSMSKNKVWRRPCDNFGGLFQSFFSQKQHTSGYL